MAKIILLTGLLCSSVLHAQDGFLLLKKRNKNLVSYFKGSRIVLQEKNGGWIEGVISKLTPDSIYLTQEVLRYNGAVTDTLRYYHTGIAIKDIVAVPTKNELVNHDSYGNIQIILGHEKFVWIRNGFVFRVMGAGYTGLNIANHLIDKDPPFKAGNAGRLAAGTGLLLFGEILKRCFYPHWRIKKKYHFQYIGLSNKGDR